MASCTTSTSNPSSDDLFPQLLSKERPFEFGRYGEPLSENSLSNNAYILSDCKILAAMDERFPELLPHFEALERTQCCIRNFLQEEADKIRRDEDDDSTDSEQDDGEESEGEDDGSTDSEQDDGEESEGEDDQIVAPAILVRFFGSKAEMAKIENRSLFYKLLLRKIDVVRCEDKDKYATLQDLEHAIYEAQEAIDKYKGFIYKNYYSIEKLEEMRPFYDKGLEKTLSKVLYEKDKASFELTMEDFDRFQCPTARLCALLGLKLDFLDRVKEMPPEHCHHRTLSDWIVTFLRNITESVPSTDRKVLTKELLDKTGFDPLSRAVETIISRSKNVQRHIEACEWAEIFIRDEFKYHPLLCSLPVPYPFQANLTNSWFQLPSRADEKSESEVDPSEVNIMNLVAQESNALNTTQAILDDFLPRDEHHALLYHATDHFSAVDILLRGIDLCAGRQKRDFSCGSGFYLTNSLDSALDWAKGTTAKPAILVFQVNDQILNDARRQNLDNNDERWSEIVSSFRLGRRTAKMRKSLNSFDLIEGPVATLAASESSEEVVFEPKPSSHQICLISDDYAEKFQQTLHSIIFYYFS